LTLEFICEGDKLGMNLDAGKPGTKNARVVAWHFYFIFAFSTAIC